MNNVPNNIDDAVTQALRSNDGVSALLKLAWTTHPELDRRQVERVRKALREVAQDRDAYIRQTCSSQSQTISTSLQNLELFQAASAQVRERGQDVILRLQRRHDECETRLLAYEKMRRARHRLMEAQNKLREVTAMVHDAKEAMDSLESGKLYHASSILSKLRMRLSSGLNTVGQSNAENGALTDSVDAELWISKELSLHVNRLHTELYQKLSAELTKWLTDSRTMAPRIGRMAILAIEEERGRKSRWAEQRAALPPRLRDVNTKAAASTLSSDALPIMLLRSAVDPYRELAMHSLLQCVHVHSQADSLPQLLAEYVEARTSQLSTDLAPPKDLMTCYQAYLWHILGYFMVEMRVFMDVPHFGTRDHVQGAWEGASAALAAELVAALDEISGIDEFTALKDHALLFCDAIDEYCTDDTGMSLSSAKVRAVFEDRRAFLLSLVKDSVLDEVANIVQKPQGNARSVVNATYEALYKALLGIVMGQTDVAIVAFSDCEAALANAIAEVHAISLMNTAEAYEEEKEKTKDENYEAEDPVLNQLMAVLAGANAVKSEFEVLRAKIIDEDKNTDTGSIPQSWVGAVPQIEESVSTIEEALARRVYTAVRPAIEAYKLVEWNSHSVPRTGGHPTGQCNEILEVLGAINGVLESNLHVPQRSRHTTLLSSLNHISEGVINILVSNAYVPAFTVFGIQHLLSDLNAMSRFAEKLVSEGDRCESESDENLGNRLNGTSKLREAVLLCELLAFNYVEDLLDDEKRKTKYAELNLERTVLLLEKLVDPPATCTGDHSLTREKALHVAAVLRGNVTT